MDKVNDKYELITTIDWKLRVRIEKIIKQLFKDSYWKGLIQVRVSSYFDVQNIYKCTHNILYSIPNWQNNVYHPPYNRY